MTNLTLLQRVCEQVNIERPTANLSALTVEQQQLLRFLDEQHIELCGKKDWWFLQRTGDLSLWPYNSGPTATLVVSSNPKVVTIAAAPFNFAQTLTTNGKLTLAGATNATDVLRVTSTSTTAANVDSTTSRPAEAVGVAWVYGQDEYAMATDCDRVSWVLNWRAGSTSVAHRFLEAISADEMENIRCNRTTYLLAGQPLNYCVRAHGTTADHIRRISFDPFPEFASNITYGYFVKPTPLYSGSTLTPELPPKYEQLLLDKAAAQYYTNLGMGAPAGSPAGQDLKSRLEETLRDVQEAESQMMGDQKAAQELASMDSSGLTRMFYGEQFGRSI